LISRHFSAKYVNVLRCFDPDPYLAPADGEHRDHGIADIDLFFPAS
jgi:hypothetical protein